MTFDTKLSAKMCVIVLHWYNITVVVEKYIGAD